jgi:hypothetical protein
MAAINNGPANILSYMLARVCNEERRDGTKSIVTFADPTPWRKRQHTGSVYKACNFTFVGNTAWNYCYCNDDGELIHKKTVYNRAKKVGMKEKEYVTANNLHKLPEWPKLKFEVVL